MLVFEERGKSEYPEKNLSEQRREPTINSTQIWRRRQDSTRATFVEGECSHNCATLEHSPLDTAAQKQFFVRLSVLNVNFLEHSRSHHCRTIVSVSGEQFQWNSSSPFLLWHFTYRSIIGCHKTLYYSSVTDSGLLSRLVIQNSFLTSVTEGFLRDKPKEGKWYTRLPQLQDETKSPSHTSHLHTAAWWAVSAIWTPTYPRPETNSGPTAVRAHSWKNKTDQLTLLQNNR